MDQIDKLKGTKLEALFLRIIDGKGEL